jgi:hypothetical protein
MKGRRRTRKTMPRKKKRVRVRSPIVAVIRNKKPAINRRRRKKEQRMLARIRETRSKKRIQHGNHHLRAPAGKSATM